MPRILNPNLDILERTVVQLGELADRLVFLGGCAVGLLLTDLAAPPVRLTHDVDVITEAATLADYYRLAELLRANKILDGRPEVAEEIGQASPELRTHLARRFQELLENPDFREALPGNMPTDAASQARVPIIVQCMRAIATLEES